MAYINSYGNSRAKTLAISETEELEIEFNIKSKFVMLVMLISG